MELACSQNKAIYCKMPALQSTPLFVFGIKSQKPRKKKLLNGHIKVTLGKSLLIIYFTNNREKKFIRSYIAI